MRLQGRETVMYKILIADDEPLNIAGIKAMLDPTVIDLAILPPVTDKASAISAIMSQNPDIVILDTRLSGISGSEIVEQIQLSEAPCPLIIMISDTGDFIEAREALRLGIFDFLVKSEITQMSLNKTLIRAVEYLDQFQTNDKRPLPSINHRLLIKMFYLRLLCSDYFPEEPEDVMQNLDIQFTYNDYAAVYVDSISRIEIGNEEREQMQRYIVSLLQKNLSQNYACQAMPWNADGYAIILARDKPIADPSGPLKEKLSHILDIIKDKFGADFAAGIGTDSNDTKRIRNSFIESQNAHSCATQEKRVIFFQEIDKNHAFNSEQAILSIAEAVQKEDIDLLNKAFDYLIDSLQTKHFHMRAVLVICTDILHITVTHVDNLSRAIKQAYNVPCPSLTVSALKSTNEMLEWIERMRGLIINCIRENGKEKKAVVVDAMKGYIEEHCEEVISLQSVADTFNFSTSYVSRLFRQYNDIGFSCYVTQTKIERAKTLLNSGENNVIRTASQLGFDDPYYFSRVFKKYVGISPREYILKRHIQ